MIGYSSPDSLAFKLCVYFARNPDEELECGDIRTKYGVDYRFRRLLKAALQNGLIAREDLGGQRSMYRPGPALLEIIGEKR